MFVAPVLCQQRKFGNGIRPFEQSSFPTSDQNAHSRRERNAQHSSRRRARSQPGNIAQQRGTLRLLECKQLQYSRLVLLRNRPGRLCFFTKNQQNFSLQKGKTRQCDGKRCGKSPSESARRFNQNLMKFSLHSPLALTYPAPFLFASA